MNSHPGRQCFFYPHGSVRLLLGFPQTGGHDAPPPPPPTLPPHGWERGVFPSALHFPPHIPIFLPASVHLPSRDTAPKLLFPITTRCISVHSHGRAGVHAHVRHCTLYARAHGLTHTHSWWHWICMEGQTRGVLSGKYAHVVPLSSSLCTPRTSATTQSCIISRSSPMTQ